MERRRGYHGPKKRGDSLCRHGFAEQVALHFVAVHQTQQARLLLGFDALGHDLELERVRQLFDVIERKNDLIEMLELA